MPSFGLADVPDQSGRTAIVTGANSGIGWEAARILAEKGARVLLGCRSLQRGAQARARIRALHSKAQVEVIELDLGSLESVRIAADQLLLQPRIDLLINNAGIMVPPRELTRDGFESQFGVNHLGHFALTGLLLERLRSTPRSRVVTVSSNAHKGAAIEFDDLHAERSYRRLPRYGMSKLANLLFTYELQRRLTSAEADVTALACHPGASMTDLSRHLPAWLLLALKPALYFMTHPPPAGAMPTVRAATDPKARGGQYYGPDGFLEFTGSPVLVESTAASHDAAAASRLWGLSMQLTGVDPLL